MTSYLQESNVHNTLPLKQHLLTALWIFLRYYYSGLPLKDMQFLERTPLYKGHNFLAVSTVNAYGALESPKDTSLIKDTIFF